MSSRLLSSALSAACAPSAYLAALAFATPLLGDGTELLGPPAGVQIEAGSDIIAAGVGLRGQALLAGSHAGGKGTAALLSLVGAAGAAGLVEPEPLAGGPGSGAGTLEVSVPAGVAVRQVLLYWEGQQSTETGQGPTDTITLNSTIAVTGNRIGGATGFLPVYWTSTYRADITDLALVAPGANAIDISGLDFDQANNGAGVLVIVDDGVTTTELEILDGNDFAFVGFTAPLDTTAPLTFTFAPSSAERVGRLRMFFSSGALEDPTGGYGRPSLIDIMVDGVLVEQLVDPLVNGDGNEWDTIAHDVTVPAGAASVTVQALSQDAGTGPFAGHLPASFSLVATGFTIDAGPSSGACCMPDGSCALDSESSCGEAGGSYMGDGTACAGASCPTPGGACCLIGGDCIETTADACAAGGGTYQGDDAICSTTLCPDLVGACCLPSGLCAQLTQTRCNALEGTYLGDYSSCAGVECPIEGACCANDGSCTVTTQETCAETSETYQGDGTACADVVCPVAQGACCLANGSCVETDEPTCIEMGGSYQGDGSTCAGVVCPAPPPSDRGCGSEKGSIVVFSKVELRWDSDGLLIQDTFLTLVNDHPDEVSVQLYFINGDEPLEAEPGERAHAGWNWVDNQMVLTGNQPTHWSAARGAPAAGGLSPFVVLDSGSPPGRPDPAGSTDRVLRGYVIAWAIGEGGAEIRFNHLAGTGTLVNSRDGTAWEYGACTFKALDPGVANGSPTGDPGVLNLDGVEFAMPYSTLLLQFQAVDSTAWSRVEPDPITTVVSTTDLTLHPLDVDMRQETDGPVTTKASFEVWNENETKLSGAHRCITCWDQSLLELYEEGANHFLLATLQTDHGKARIDGIASQLCDVDYDLGDGLPLGEDPRDVVSSDAALLGLAAKFLTIGSAGQAAAGGQLIGMGVQPAIIRHDATGALPPESNAPPPTTERGGSFLQAPLDGTTNVSGP